MLDKDQTELLSILVTAHQSLPKHERPDFRYGAALTRVAGARPRTYWEEVINRGGSVSFKGSTFTKIDDIPWNLDHDIIYHPCLQGGQMDTCQADIDALRLGGLIEFRMDDKFFVTPKGLELVTRNEEVPPAQIIPAAFGLQTEQQNDMAFDFKLLTKEQNGLIDDLGQAARRIPTTKKHRDFLFSEAADEDIIYHPHLDGWRLEVLRGDLDALEREGLIHTYDHTDGAFAVALTPMGIEWAKEVAKPMMMVPFSAAGGSSGAFASPVPAPDLGPQETDAYTVFFDQGIRQSSAAGQAPQFGQYHQQVGAQYNAGGNIFVGADPHKEPGTGIHLEVIEGFLQTMQLRAPGEEGQRWDLYVKFYIDLHASAPITIPFHRCKVICMVGTYLRPTTFTRVLLKPFGTSDPTGPQVTITESGMWELKASAHTEDLSEQVHSNGKLDATLVLSPSREEVPLNAELVSAGRPSGTWWSWTIAPMEANGAP